MMSLFKYLVFSLLELVGMLLAAGTILGGALVIALFCSSSTRSR